MVICRQISVGDIVNVIIPKYNDIIVDLRDSGLAIIPKIDMYLGVPPN